MRGAALRDRHGHVGAGLQDGDRQAKMETTENETVALLEPQGQL